MVIPKRKVAGKIRKRISKFWENIRIGSKVSVKCIYSSRSCEKDILCYTATYRIIRGNLKFDSKNNCQWKYLIRLLEIDLKLLMKGGSNNIIKLGIKSNSKTRRFRLSIEPETLNQITREDDETDPDSITIKNLDRCFPWRLFTESEHLS